MGFRKISFVIIFGLIIISCSDKKDQSIENESLVEKDSISTENSQSMSFESHPTMKGWLDFYKKENPEMGLGNFEMLETKKLDMMEGSVSGIFDTEFDSVYMPFLIFNPSKTMYLDLDSYNWVLDEDGTAMFEADQEVNLVDLKDNTGKRVGFYGPSHWAEDAFWMNDSVFVLLENSDQNEMSFQLINLKENSISSYINTETLKAREEFYNDLRLNRKGVKVLHD